MVKHYTVQTSNAFAALGDDSDSEDVILPLAAEIHKAPAAAQPQQQSPTKARREPVGLTGQQPAREGGAAPAPREGGSAPREGVPSERRGPRREGERPGERRPRREPRAAGDEGVVTAESERRPPRPAGRGPRQVREGKREFDRVSGTGRGTEIKREGGGAYNWGKQELKPDVWNMQQEAETEQAAGEQAQESPKAEQPEAGEQAAAEQQPAQPKTFTYAQYKRQMEEKLGAAGDDSAARAAELEVERQKAIKEGYTLYTKETKAKEDEERREDRKERGGVKTLSLAEVAEQSGVSLNYGGARRGGAGRGEGRGGPRREGGEERPRGEGRGEGRRGGSGSRGEQKPRAGGDQSTKEINLVDNQAFPTLQAH